jgi:hypothetical protein
MQALDLEGTPYYRDALEAIVELGYRRHEIEDDWLLDELRKLDPFIRECFHALIRQNNSSMWQSTRHPGEPKGR